MPDFMHNHLRFTTLACWLLLGAALAGAATPWHQASSPFRAEFEITARPELPEAGLMLNVPVCGLGAADGSDWINAYTKVSDGISAIGGTRTNIWITGAVYSEGSLLTLATSATVIGGYAAPGASESLRVQTPDAQVHPVPLIETSVSPAGGPSVTPTGPNVLPPPARLESVTV